MSRKGYFRARPLGTGIFLSTLIGLVFANGKPYLLLPSHTYLAQTAEVLQADSACIVEIVMETFRAREINAGVLFGSEFLFDALDHFLLRDRSLPLPRQIFLDLDAHLAPQVGHKRRAHLRELDHVFANAARVVDLRRLDDDGRSFKGGEREAIEEVGVGLPSDEEPAPCGDPREPRGSELTIVVDGETRFGGAGIEGDDHLNRYR